MGRTLPLLTLCLLSVTLLSGCTFEQGADGQSAIGPGSVSHQGTLTDAKTSKAISCGSSGKVNVNYQGSGTLSIKVRDGVGATIFSKDYNANGQASDTTSISGKSGDWVLVAEGKGSGYGGTGGYGGFGTQQYTGSGFSGQFNANIAC